MKYFIWLLAISLSLVACNSASTGETTKTAEKETPVVTKPATTTSKPASLVKWMSFEEAQQLNAKTPKKIIVDVYTDWCGPCKMMDRSTFSDPGVAKVMNENFYPVKFNAESAADINFKGKVYSNPNYNPDIPKNRRNSAHQLVRNFAIRGYPTLVVLDEELNMVKGDVANSLVGFKQPAQLLPILAKL